MKSREQFFYENAGYSYDPKTQSREQGQQEGAAKLAAAEWHAFEEGMMFEWYPDTEPDEWVCVAVDAEGECVGSLGGVDFGGAEPWGQPYARVVQAELALEHYTDTYSGTV